MPYMCDANDGRPAIVVIQKLVDDADSVAWCEEHWPQFITANYQAMFPEDEPIPFTTATGPDDDRDDDDDDATPAPGPQQPQTPPAGTPGDVDPAQGDAPAPEALVT